MITDSEFSRREIEAAYGLAPERVRVIPLGSARPLRRLPLNEALRGAIASPTILHVGDLHARSNVGVLIEMLALLRGRNDALRRTTLVLAGEDRGAGPDLRARATTLGVADSVRFLPAASDQAFVSLMRQADVFAYPSLYEGLGCRCSKPWRAEHL